MKEDYTLECLDYINEIIQHGREIKMPTPSTVEEEDASLFAAVRHRWHSLVALSTLSPKEVYSKFMTEEQIIDPVFAWALWWAKESEIISHHGPGGTKGWALYRSNSVTVEEVYIGSYSPFNPSSMMKFMDHILKYSSLVNIKTMESHREFEESIEKTRNELESEKEFARMQSRMVWS